MGCCFSRARYKCAAHDVSVYPVVTNAFTQHNHQTGFKGEGNGGNQVGGRTERESKRGIGWEEEDTREYLL